MSQLLRHGRGLVAAMLVLGFAAEVHAGVPLGILAQRRGGFRMPSKPAIVDSSPQIDTLKKALTALGSTDRDYDGHREKAVLHVGLAIRHLETASGRGKNNAAIEKAASGKPATATRTATTPQAASDESLRKAKTILFSAHHYLTNHTATRGHLRADAEVRIAINEIVEALKPPKATPATSTTGASTTTTITPRPPK